MMTRVNELIDPGTGQWDEELIRQTFWQQDVDIILATPVHYELDDPVAWHYDKRGCFPSDQPTKFQRACDRRERERGEASSSNGSMLEEKHWKQLWKINCPGKLKHFFWRMAHDSLAVRMTLERRGMSLDTRCVMCNRQNEHGGHAFFTCKYVKHVWLEGL